MKNKRFLYLITLFVYAISLPLYSQQGYLNVTIQTSGHCSECKKTIEKALAFEKGVKKSTFDASNGKVVIQYNPQKTKPDILRQAITHAGYDADSMMADPKAYKHLKECCKKEGRELMNH